MTLRPCRNIPHEYYSANAPGTIQYHEQKQDLLQLIITVGGDTRGYVFDEHTAENRARLLTYKKNPEDYTLILVMKRVTEDGQIWLKGALQHKKTGEIALMTSTNTTYNTGRVTKSNDDGWLTGCYRITAPMCFWRELQNRLMY